MSGAESFHSDEKRGKRQQMATEAASMAGLFQENRGVHIASEPIRNSNENSKPKSKGKTKDPKDVLFNDIGQPVGSNSTTFATFLGRMGKVLVPLTVTSWFNGGISDQHKDLIWKHVKIWIREVIEDVGLFRPNSEFSTISAEIGCTVAWHSKFIKYMT